MNLKLYKIISLLLYTVFVVVLGIKDEYPIELMLILITGPVFIMLATMNIIDRVLKQ